MTANTAPVPTRYSYAVERGKLYAGEYPRDFEEAASRKKIQGFLDFGISDFVDLTCEGELEPYTRFLPPGIGHHRFPVQDPCLAPVDVMYDIITKIERLVGAGRKVYVHCWGGIDRTGGVVAAWFVRRGMTARQAFEAYKKCWGTNPKAYMDRHTPAIQLNPGYLDEFEKYALLRKEEVCTEQF